jgi:hypothetical protein
MVPHNYWMAERILQQKARLTKQPKPPTKEITNNEVFLSQALTPVTYLQADLAQIAHNCTDLDINHQSSLLRILCNHKTLILGRCGNWKGHPVTIKVMEEVTPAWSKPYPVPLKKTRSIQGRSLPAMTNRSSMGTHSRGD